MQQLSDSGLAVSPAGPTHHSEATGCGVVVGGPGWGGQRWGKGANVALLLVYFRCVWCATDPCGMDCCMLGTGQGLLMPHPTIKDVVGVACP